MKHRGKVYIVLGLLCFMLAALLVVDNQAEDVKAGDESDKILTGVEAQIPDTPPETVFMTEDEESDEEGLSGEMRAVDVDGWSYIGTIEMPAIEIKLPIQREWSSAGAKISPCRYKGSVYENDLIIAAHNYQRHFGKIGQLVSGDEVIITDVDGRKFHYKVFNQEIIDTFDIDGMDAGDWDLTVFTCTIGGRSRVTVRCSFDYQD